MWELVLIIFIYLPNTIYPTPTHHCKPKPPNPLGFEGPVPPLPAGSHGQTRPAPHQSDSCPEKAGEITTQTSVPAVSRAGPLSLLCRQSSPALQCACSCDRGCLQTASLSAGPTHQQIQVAKAGPLNSVGSKSCPVAPQIAKWITGVS